METVISSYESIENQNRIIELFETEQNKYIELLTILSVLLTVFTIFETLKKIIEKNEIESLKNEIITIKNDNVNFLRMQKSEWALKHIEQITFSNNANSNLVLQDNTVVNSFELYEKFIVNSCTEILHNYDLSSIKDKISGQSFFIALYNYFLSINYHLQLRFDINTNVLIDVNQNMVIKDIVQILSNTLSKQQFELFRNQLLKCTSNTVKFRVF